MERTRMCAKSTTRMARDVVLATLVESIKLSLWQRRQRLAMRLSVELASIHKKVVIVVV